MYRVETGHSSTSMTNRLALFLLFTMLTAPFVLAQQEQTTAQVTLAQRVARLGAHGNDDIADVKQLATNPQASAELLIARAPSCS